MSHLIIKKLASSSSNTLITHLTLRYIHQNPIFTITKPFSSSSSTSNVSNYLVNSCGVLPNKAKMLSNKYRLINIEKSKALIEFLEKNGFNQSHISKIVSWEPRLLKCRSPEKTLMPKIEFLYSIGVKKRVVGDIICGCLTILTRSLDKVFIPCYDLLRSVGFSDKDIVMILKRRPWLFLHRCDDNVVANVRFLREIGVSQSRIVYLIGLWTDVVFVDHVVLSKCVNEVVGLGFDVKKTSFLWALCATFNDRSKEILKRSFKAFEKWGWSKDDCLLAYRKHPQCMFLSEKNIMKKMDFFVNKIGLDSREVCDRSNALCYSLEKRISPRFSVARVLEKKGLLNKRQNLSTLLGMKEKKFIEKYIDKYIADVPELYIVYKASRRHPSYEVNNEGRSMPDAED